MYFLQPNQKKLLSSLNPLFSVLFVFGLVLVRSVADSIFPGYLNFWDTLLPVIIYFGQRRTFLEGFVLSLFVGHLYSLCSAAPIGVFTIHYLLLFIVARLISYGIYASSWYSVLALIFSLGLYSRISVITIAYLFGHGWPIFLWDNFSIFALLFNSFQGLLVFYCLTVFDRMTFKVPRINIELAEEGL